jgi:hypothetical protein
MSALSPHYPAMSALSPNYLSPNYPERRGLGERPIAWFEESGFADRLAPVHAAFVASVRGARTLLDVGNSVTVHFMH